MWKTKLGHTLHRTADGICVKQNPWYRWLMLESDAIQSCINRIHPEKPALAYIKPLTFAARLVHGQCCLLGLGGGGVAHYLGGFADRISLYAVEHSAEVISVSKQYFRVDGIQNLQIVQQDAFQFVQYNESQYQHILVDLFGANSFPQHCFNRDFFAHCFSRLTTNGVLAINLANTKEHWPLFQLVREVFLQRTLVLPVQGTGNLIILAYRADTLLPLHDLVRKQRDIKRLAWDGMWGYVAFF